MREIFIITPGSFELADLIHSARKVGWSLNEGRETVAMRHGDEYVDFKEMPDVAKYYEDTERELIKECGADPRFFRMRFHDYKAAAEAITHLLPVSPFFALDNDHGLILSLDRFATLRPTCWDWTTVDSV